MHISYTEKSITIASAQALIFFVHENFEFSQALQRTADSFFPSLQQFLTNESFTGKKGSLVSVPIVAQGVNRLLVIAGLGKKDGLTVESYRRALGTVVKMLQKKKVASVAIQLPAATDFNVHEELLAQETAVIATMALYHYDEYLSKDAQRKQDIDFIVHGHGSAESLEAAVQKGLIIARGVNQARTWIDMPPAALNPAYLANEAEKIAKKHALKCTVFSEPEIIKMGMGGLAGVSAGSDNDCKLVILEYKTAKKDAPTIAFVGKGITFDSGGLSIKPAAGMENMKDDMSGASAVISALDIIAQIKPDVNVIGVTPIAENMPSGKATRPGDIVRFYNGKTAEVRNTDAEGRLILADALSYVAKHYKPNAIIDIATLTGMCAYFFGPFYTAMLSNNKTVENNILAASARTGEKIWPLPHDEDYKQAITSHIADIQNTGKENIKSGTITAGFFLENFVDNVPWAHLDIAGTSFDTPMIPYFNEGATGAGVRLFVDLAQHWKN